MKLITLPGLIDPHVHLRDMGLNHKEDFYTGTSAALAGGFTTVVDMPNNMTPIFTLADLREKIKTAKTKTVCNLGFYFGTDGKNLNEFKKVKGLVLGLKVYLNETTGNFLTDWRNLKKIFIAWPKTAGPILLHAEDKAVPFAIKVIEKTKKRTHFCHISTKKDLLKILKAKKRGLPITCGVTPHHLFLTVNDLKKLKGLGIMKPPLATQADQDFLWKHLDDIDIIESDHAPHSLEEKTAEKPAYGIPGLETTLPLLLTAVSEGRLTIKDIKRLCYQGPIKLLMNSPHPRVTNIPVYWTEANNRIIVDLEEEWTIKNENLKTKCGWSSFAGREVIGKVKEVYLQGKIVYKNSRILTKPGSGKIITY